MGGDAGGEAPDTDARREPVLGPPNSPWADGRRDGRAAIQAAKRPRIPRFFTPSNFHCYSIDTAIEIRCSREKFH